MMNARKIIKIIIELPTTLLGIFWEWLKRYCLWIIFWVVTVFLMWGSWLLGGGGLSDPYRFNSQEVISVILRLEYLTHLTQTFVEKGGQLPPEEKRVPEAIKYFRESIDIDEDFVDYLRSLSLSTTEKDPLNTMVAHIAADADSPFWRRVTIVDDPVEALQNRTEESFDFSRNDDNYRDYCFFERRKELDGTENIFIAARSNLLTRIAGNEAFLLVIVSAMDGRYFQDFEGTPYQEGPIVIMKINLSPAEALDTADNHEDGRI